MDKASAGTACTSPGPLLMLWLLVLTAPWLGGSVPVSPGESQSLRCAQGVWDCPLGKSFHGPPRALGRPVNLFLQTPACDVSGWASWGAATCQPGGTRGRSA